MLEVKWMLRSHWFEKTKPGHLEQESKNHVTLQQVPETSLEEYKNSYFDSYTEKQIFLYATDKKKRHILQYYRWLV